ncbi:MAG: polysaccharide biosynthesis tyrosine autokinase [Candidatus Dormibacteria bacterium]
MDPQEIRRLLHKWAAFVAVLAVVGAAAAFGVSRMITPQYESDGSLLVLATLQQQVAQSLTPTTTTTQVTSTYAVLMTASPLLQRVAKEVDLRETPEEMSKHIKVTPERDTQILQVAVTDPSPERAQQVANQWINDFLANKNQEQGQPVDPAAADLGGLQKDIQDDLDSNQQQLAALRPGDRTDPAPIGARIKRDRTQLNLVSTIQSKLNASDVQTQPRVALVSPARLPVAAASPRVLLNTAVGGFLGLLIAIGLVALLEYFDQGLRSEEDVRRLLSVATIGVVPTFAETPGKSPSARRRNEHAAEAYRRLRTNLRFASVEKVAKTVVITSSYQGEGKTSTSANLARIVAASGQRVLLADADMRRPSQHVLFSKPLVNGMSEMLLGAAHGIRPSLDGEHRTYFRNLWLLTAGVIPPNPAELLASKHVGELITDLGERHDMVVFDTPPVGVVTDALGLAAGADAAILVVKAGGSARQASRTIEALRGVGANVVGVVLNKAKDSRATGYYYYEGYYAPAARDATTAPRGDQYDEGPMGTWVPITRTKAHRGQGVQRPPPPQP